jgi:Trp operon repressor
MYDVPPKLWISVVEMYMEGPASRWYQSLAPQLPYLTWNSFCQLLHDRFDRDQHEVLLHQLFNIRHHTTMSAYVKSFSELVDQLTSYSHVHDPLYFTMRFIDGLRLDIKAIMIVQ